MLKIRKAIGRKKLEGNSYLTIRVSLRLYLIIEKYKIWSSLYPMYEIYSLKNLAKKESGRTLYRRPSTRYLISFFILLNANTNVFYTAELKFNVMILVFGDKNEGNVAL